MFELDTMSLHCYEPKPPMIRTAGFAPSPLVVAAPSGFA